MGIKELHEQGTLSGSCGEGVEIPSDLAKTNRFPNLVYARAESAIFDTYTDKIVMQIKILYEFRS